MCEKYGERSKNNERKVHRFHIVAKRSGYHPRRKRQHRNAKRACSLDDIDGERTRVWCRTCAGFSEPELEKLSRHCSRAARKGDRQERSEEGYEPTKHSGERRLRLGEDFENRETSATSAEAHKTTINGRRNTVKNVEGTRKRVRLKGGTASKHGKICTMKLVKNKEDKTNKMIQV